MSLYEKYLKIGLVAINQASDFLKEGYGSIKEMKEKDTNHYGIADDIKTNEIIEEYLRKVSPECSIFSEEGERNLNSEFVWVIDPIDGTSNYRVGIPLFVSQICLLHKGDPVVAILKAPVLDMTFTAEKGNGAYLNNERIHGADIKEMKKAMLTVSKGRKNEFVGRYINKLASHVRTVRSFGSTGIDLAYIASGKCDIMITSSGNLYDFAPGVLLVKESGGKVVNFQGKDWSQKDDEFLATNSFLVEEVLAYFQ